MLVVVDERGAAIGPHLYQARTKPLAGWIALSQLHRSNHAYYVIIYLIIDYIARLSIKLSK
jgi:hypothetical protein